jgi:hypothetical protein
MTIRKPLVVVSIAAAVAALSACLPTADKNYHGSVGGAGAPVSTVSTPAVPAVPAYPVTVNGSGEQVKTADLVAAGCTVTYQASSNCLIVKPVQSDGSEGIAVVSACGRGDDPASGTTTYRGTGRTTFHVFNTQGPWSLTFTPL